MLQNANFGRSSIVQIIFSFLSFEISEVILRNKKIIIGLDSFSNLSLIILAQFWIRLVFVLTTLLKDAKITVILFGSMLPNLIGSLKRLK